MSSITTANVYLGTGRRKTASARVRLTTEGTGKITVNGRAFEDYCYDENLQRISSAPLTTADMRESVDLVVKVVGGGPNGQAEAIAHALARALERYNPELRPALKKAGHLKRDPRRRERKKAGQPGARKRFQFSKR
ncbi:MAG: small subunit ribosomal protein S9 [Puniceicoccaceae bacterium 5H]|nr:MAG: small subunit ribosomal protein S9 [Puniceicoccaceae bacterium 5H]